MDPAGRSFFSLEEKQYCCHTRRTIWVLSPGPSLSSSPFWKRLLPQLGALRLQSLLEGTPPHPQPQPHPLAQQLTSLQSVVNCFKLPAHRTNNHLMQWCHMFILQEITACEIQIPLDPALAMPKNSVHHLTMETTILFLGTSQSTPQPMLPEGGTSTPPGGRLSTSTVLEPPGARLSMATGSRAARGQQGLSSLPPWSSEGTLLCSQGTVRAGWSPAPFTKACFQLHFCACVCIWVSHPPPPPHLTLYILTFSFPSIKTIKSK